MVEVAFQSQLARDVFQAAFGYLLHPVLRDELRGIYSIDTIVTDYRHDVKVTQVPDSDLVTVRETITRIISPLSDKPVKMTFEGSFDDYQIGGIESRVVEEAFFQDGVEWSTSNGEIPGGYKRKNKDSLPIRALGGKKDVVLERDKPLTHRWIQETAHWKNGEVVHFFNSPSLGARVTIEVPEGYISNAGFANWHEGKSPRIGEGDYRVDVLILPLQGISIRWYSEDAGKWESETT